MKDEHNRHIKKVVGETLKQIDISINGVRVPLLDKDTREIIIGCNDGEVGEITPRFKIK